MPLRRLAVVTLALALPAGLTVAAQAAPAGTGAESVKPLRVHVASNRADLVSGGDALVWVGLPAGVRPGQVQVSVGMRDVTRRFALRPDGRFEGLVTRLRVGENVLRATAPGWSGSVTVVNHPNGGPVFSGPQLGPYVCQSGATDAQCDQPATYTLLYKSSDPAEADLKPYDPANPPSDVATTTTDQGVEVPFVVRQETGYQDRDQYKILTLFRPGKAWKPWAPQRQWNHKVLVTHGGNCGAAYTPGDAPLDDYSGTLEGVPGYTDSYVTALGRGFAVMSTALDNTGHNCNPVTQAESLLMAKERLVERYGPIRYTIGTGCSGGSIAQQTVANAYPGIYQGLVTTCSYPDSMTAGAQFLDYLLLRGYFEDPSRWAPGVVWSPTQFADVEGHLSHINSVTATEGLLKAAINPTTPCPGTKDTVPGDRSTRFDPQTNPAGVRCSILDMMRNPLGTRPQADWTAPEKAAGFGFAGVPIGNVGVQYGLGALQKGQITPGQFVDLNAKVGALDVNAQPTAERFAGDPGALRNAYRTGIIDEANNLDGVAIINHGGPDPGAAHDYSHAYWTQARLERAQGHTRNRVMWFGETPLIGDPSWSTEAFLSMDRWLSAVEKDHGDLALPRKIVRDKPADLQDRCSNVPGFEMVTLPDGSRVCDMPQLQTRLGSPRMVAGGDVANDITACTLKPLLRSDYLPTLFTDDEWASLQRTFPDGVCDWSRPGIGQGPTRTWLEYGAGGGDPVYGGRALPAPPAGSATGWASSSFRSLLRQ